jgi:hypothetical protein
MAIFAAGNLRLCKYVLHKYRLDWCSLMYPGIRLIKHESDPCRVICLSGAQYYWGIMPLHYRLRDQRYAECNRQLPLDVYRHCHLRKIFPEQPGWQALAAPFPTSHKLFVCSIPAARNKPACRFPKTGRNRHHLPVQR